MVLYNPLYYILPDILLYRYTHIEMIPKGYIPKYVMKCIMKVLSFTTYSRRQDMAMAISNHHKVTSHS